MKRFLFNCAALLIFSLSCSPASANDIAGTWSIQPSSQPGEIHLQMQYRHSENGDTESWSESNDVPLGSLRGLSSADMSAGGHRAFSIVQDAGTFRADGTFNSGMGGGTWTFQPDPGFAQALRQRGIGAPTELQQFHLAISGFKISTLDMLLHSGFSRPSVDDLARLSEHGVNDEYINAMKNLRFSDKTFEALVRLRDHGVGPKYAATMLQIDRNLSTDDLIRMRDHGVSDSYVASLSRLGYHPSAEELVQLVDHGVSASFIERMRTHGYTHLSVADLIRLRDHGF